MKTERAFATNGNFFSHYLDGFASGSSSESGYGTISTSSSSSNSSPSSPVLNGHIEHRVTKMDTLAGVAIKYGVEVADIRRMNGLVTDLQMFAHKSLQIPLPGRHPPSPVQLNGASTNGEQTTPRCLREDILDSLQSLKLTPLRNVSPAMDTFQGFNGLAPCKTGPVIEGTEMAVYKTGRDQLLPRESPGPDSVFSWQRKSRSLISLENGDVATVVAETVDDGESDRFIRRRQQVEVDLSVQTPVTLLKEESGGGFSGRMAKGLALRPKNSVSIMDSLLADVFVSVRKSSSTSNLHETENAASSIWPSGKWSDAFAKPIFDGLPKPAPVRRNKAALD